MTETGIINPIATLNDVFRTTLQGGWKWQYKSAPVLEQLTVKKYTTSPA